MNRVACFHSASTTCKTLQTPRGSTRRCCSLPLTSPSRLAHTCIRCAAVPEEPSVSDALSKTTAVFQLAQGETPSLAKQRATLTRDLEEAVAREDYAAAALCRDQLKQLDASDPVARLKAALQVAIEEERFADAATLRDELKDALQSTTNLAEIPVSSDTVTHNIRVRVKSFYVPQQSSPARGLYFFAYSITITNEGEQTVILKNRHWLITDEEGQTEDVRYVVFCCKRGNTEVLPVFACLLLSPHNTAALGWWEHSQSSIQESRFNTLRHVPCVHLLGACRVNTSLQCWMHQGSGGMRLRWRLVVSGSTWSTS